MISAVAPAGAGPTAPPTTSEGPDRLIDRVVAPLLRASACRGLDPPLRGAGRRPSPASSWQAFDRGVRGPVRAAVLDPNHEHRVETPPNGRPGCRTAEPIPPCRFVESVAARADRRRATRGPASTCLVFVVGRSHGDRTAPERWSDGLPSRRRSESATREGSAARSWHGTGDRVVYLLALAGTAPQMPETDRSQDALTAVIATGSWRPSSAITTTGGTGTAHARTEGGGPSIRGSGRADPRRAGSSQIVLRAMRPASASRRPGGMGRRRSTGSLRRHDRGTHGSPHGGGMRIPRHWSGRPSALALPPATATAV